MVAPIKLGIVGAAGSRAKATVGFDVDDRIDIHAVCDIRHDALDGARERFCAPEEYQYYKDLIAEGSVDAVYLSTPDHLHARQAILALENDVHVLSEVPAACTIEDAKRLVAAARESDAVYMMNEETVYWKKASMVGEMVDEGLFGDVYYAEGEYLNNHLIEQMYCYDPTPWRREWQVGQNGVTYPTHSLAPILTHWMPDDRIDRLTCAGSGHHHSDPDGVHFEQEDTTLFLAKTEQDRLIRIRQDFISDRGPTSPGGKSYQLQGTGGSYEEARTPLDTDKVWLAALAEDKESWQMLEDFEFEYLPEHWQNPPEKLEESLQNHEDSDYYTTPADFFTRREFVDCISEGETPIIGVFEALDLSLPAPVSHQSIENDGEWTTVPDPRTW